MGVQHGTIVYGATGPRSLLRLAYGVSVAVGRARTVVVSALSTPMVLYEILRLLTTIGVKYRRQIRVKSKGVKSRYLTP